MAGRAGDWLKQARRDLEHARRALEDGDYEWACFAARQAAAKAVGLGAEARGHAVSGLLERLPPGYQPAPELEAAAKELDKHYIPARYPNSYPEGAPFEYYTAAEAERAVEYAERILRFCEDNLVRP